MYDTFNKMLEETQAPSSDGEHKAGPSRVEKMEAVSGISFVLMLISLTLACFIIMLDNSIVATVRCVAGPLLFETPRLTVLSRQFRVSPMNSILSMLVPLIDKTCYHKLTKYRILVGMEVPISWGGQSESPKLTPHHTMMANI